MDKEKTDLDSYTGDGWEVFEYPEPKVVHRFPITYIAYLKSKDPDKVSFNCFRRDGTAWKSRCEIVEFGKLDVFSEILSHIKWKENE